MIFLLIIIALICMIGLYIALVTASERKPHAVPNGLSFVCIMIIYLWIIFEVCCFLNMSSDWKSIVLVALWTFLTLPLAACLVFLIRDHLTPKVEHLRKLGKAKRYEKGKPIEGDVGIEGHVIVTEHLAKLPGVDVRPATIQLSALDVFEGNYYAVSSPQLIQIKTQFGIVAIDLDAVPLRVNANRRLSCLSAELDTILQPFKKSHVFEEKIEVEWLAPGDLVYVVGIPDFKPAAEVFGDSETLGDGPYREVELVPVFGYGSYLCHWTASEEMQRRRRELFLFSAFSLATTAFALFRMFLS